MKNNLGYIKNIVNKHHKEWHLYLNRKEESICALIFHNMLLFLNPKCTHFPQCILFKLTLFFGERSPLKIVLI